MVQDAVNGKRREDNNSAGDEYIATEEGEDKKKAVSEVGDVPLYYIREVRSVMAGSLSQKTH